MKKAVDHFLKGEYDQINDGLSASGSMIAKGIDDNNDDGFGYEETGMFIPDENSQEDDVDKWFDDNTHDKSSKPTRKVDLKMAMIHQRELIEDSVRNDLNMKPDAIMNKIKESQECEAETFEKQYIIDDASLDMEDIGVDDWMFQTKKWAKEEKPTEEPSSSLNAFLQQKEPEIENPPSPPKTVEEDSHAAHKAKCRARRKHRRTESKTFDQDFVAGLQSRPVEVQDNL